MQHSDMPYAHIANEISTLHEVLEYKLLLRQLCHYGTFDHGTV